MSCWSRCTGNRNSMTCLRSLSTPYGGGRNASRWLRVWDGHRRLLRRCNRGRREGHVVLIEGRARVLLFSGALVRYILQFAWSSGLLVCSELRADGGYSCVQKDVLPRRLPKQFLRISLRYRSLQSQHGGISQPSHLPANSPQGCGRSALSVLQPALPGAKDMSYSF